MTAKWLIEKCRRGRQCWHVTGPNISTEPEFPLWEEHEFHTGAAAIAFVAERLGERDDDEVGPDWPLAGGGKDSYRYEAVQALRGDLSL